MSERTTNENARRNRRRRLGRRLLSRNKEAVSPVVATLILILVAVAAAAALYLWLSGWQAGVTKSIGNPGPQYSVTIGGSTTVYPFDQAVVPWFMQNNSAVVVSDNVGGSGAGILAVCAGQVDIGASSRALTATDLANCPALQNAVQTRLALAAIVPITSTAVAAPALGFTATSGWSEAVLASVWQTNGGGATSGTSIVGGTGSAIATLVSQPGGGTQATTVYATDPWGLNAAVVAPAIAGCAGGVATCYTWNQVPNNWGSATCNGNGVSGNVQGCTFSANTNEIKLYDRADNSGTEANFASKLLGQGKCGSDGQVDSCGVKASTSGGASNNGNPAVVAAVGKDALALGFTDVGQVTPAVIGQEFQNTTQTLPVSATTSTIKAAAASSATAPFAGDYGGWTPLEYITIGQPTGEVQRFIQFAMGPSVNQVACTLNGYVSVYS